MIPQSRAGGRTASTTYAREHILATIGINTAVTRAVFIAPTQTAH